MKNNNKYNENNENNEYGKSWRQRVVRRITIAGIFSMSCIILGSACAGNSDGVNQEALITIENSTEPGAEVDSKSEVKKSEIDSEQHSEQTSGTVLRYIDAWQEWHETVIREDIEKHTYDWSCLQNDGQNISYEGDEDYTIRKGVDVSYHQGEIDWNRVKQAGYDFAIVRIAYRGYGEAGLLKLDTESTTYLKEAKAAGLDVGVYVFSQAVNEQEALEEADLVISTLKENDIALDLPVTFDPEHIRDDVARTDEVSGAQFTRNVIVFCERVKEAGYTPMVYSNMIWESEQLDLAQLADYLIWYADYELTPQTPYAFDFWQYSESGQVDGISGVVDLNVQFMKNKAN